MGATISELASLTMTCLGVGGYRRVGGKDPEVKDEERKDQDGRAMQPIPLERGRLMAGFTLSDGITGVFDVQAEAGEKQ